LLFFVGDKGLKLTWDGVKNWAMSHPWNVSYYCHPFLTNSFCSCKRCEGGFLTS
jgi:hypothetical protein